MSMTVGLGQDLVPQDRDPGALASWLSTLCASTGAGCRHRPTGTVERDYEETDRKGPSHSARIEPAPPGGRTVGVPIDDTIAPT